MAEKVKLMNVRLSYPRLGVPEFYKGAKTKDDEQRRWSACLLIVPGSDADKAIRSAIQKVAIAHCGADKAAKRLQAIKADAKAFCYQDGNRKEKDEYEGLWYINAHRKESLGRPAVVDRRNKPVYARKADQAPAGHDLNVPLPGQAGVIYAGCYVNAQIEIWAWGKKNSLEWGVSSTLLGLQKHADGDSFGGGSAVSDDAFDALDAGSDADDMDLDDDDIPF